MDINEFPVRADEIDLRRPAVSSKQFMISGCFIIATSCNGRNRWERMNSLKRLSHSDPGRAAIRPAESSPAREWMQTWKYCRVNEELRGIDREAAFGSAKDGEGFRWFAAGGGGGGADWLAWKEAGKEFAPMESAMAREVFSQRVSISSFFWKLIALVASWYLLKEKVCCKVFTFDGPDCCWE